MDKINYNKHNCTTLCYIEKDDSYLMLHRIKKEKDINKDKWIGVGGHFEEGEFPEECLLREVREETGLELTSFRLLEEELPVFSLKLRYEGDNLIETVLNGNKFKTKGAG